MRLSVERTWQYTPTWQGNDADDNPAVFTFRYLTPAEHRQCVRYDQIALALSDESDEGAARSQVSIDYDKLVRLCTESIENLEVEVDGKVQKLQTGRELLACSYPGLRTLVDEVSTHLLTKNQRVSQKNSQSPTT